MTETHHPEVDWPSHTPRWVGVETRTVMVDGHPVHALWHPGEGTGTPRLLVHGLGGNATNWLEVMSGLAQQGPVLAVDLPGFGRTVLHDVDEARLAPQRRFLTRLVDTLGWDAVELHGNSMGGLLCILVAASEPALATGLVLTAPALPAPRSLGALSGEVAMRFAPFVSARVGTAVLRRLWERVEPHEMWLRTTDLLVDDPDVLPPELKAVSIANVERARDDDWRAPGFAIAASDLLRHLFLREEIERAIEAVAAPTLLIWGSQDRLVSRAAVDRALTRRPDWSRAVLSGVGHVPMMEVPDAHLEAIRGWREQQGAD